ncbi:sua5/yciO/yrdC/ywlC family protein [Alkalihalophilus pseudofirmus OF4]|uniref:Threonylcarbamoyl-AMP synthase n=1 Tax=Alkalihalophilus pseudofirmus (strain ATCC BAA-2126 / JCM 17055 / OF4) TaxID=398511 RepID=D3G0H1_ALKPO|nr:L-threonylcarbamoyladenylate synthase [Alkalihalophilus pseudofirmus]ADC49446.1 sua5/yciO/yrdC/ywlC family protein [Alkalihalophilus pseudofirmus OF4]
MSYKQTKIFNVDKINDEDKKREYISDAALWISEGEVVAFPTETVYGLGANALDEKAIAKIFEAKGRPSDNPLIVHIANRDQLSELVTEITPAAEKLMEAFWPGPLTIIFKKKGPIAPNVTAGLDTVAIRMPSHPLALKLIKAANVPVAAPSANLSGKPSPTTAAHVYHDLQGRIAGVVDGGSTGVGLESTVLDCSVHPPMLYRPGGVTIEELKEVVGEVAVDPSLKNTEDAPRSPGMKYTHYAPKGSLTLVHDVSRIQALLDEAREQGKKVGVLTTEERAAEYKADTVIACGAREDLSTVAAKLYEALRQFDQENVDVIYSETFPNEGVGAAIMNRLEKAAGGRVI